MMYTLHMMILVLLAAVCTFNHGMYYVCSVSDIDNIMCMILFRRSHTFIL